VSGDEETSKAVNPKMKLVLEKKYANREKLGNELLGFHDKQGRLWN